MGTLGGLSAPAVDCDHQLVTHRGLRALARIAAVALVAGLAATPSRAGAAPAGGPMVELIVSTEPGADLSAIGEIVEARAARGVSHRPDLSVLRIEASRLGDVTEQLEARDDVAFAAPVAVAHMAAVNDPLVARQWHLADRSRFPGASNWAPVGSPGLGAGAVVAVLDTGITAHSDIDGLLPGTDLVDGDADASDPHGHGTHVAGTVAESTGNGIGAAGVAPGASVLPVRVLDATGNAPYDRIFSAIAYATERGADVINLSLAGPTDAGICDAVSRAVAAGVVVVAAAGNDAGPVAYPAACSDAIGISAVSQTALVSSYSNRGSQVDLAAPGGEPADLNLDGDPDGVLQYSVFNNTPGYYFSSGTSMAAPHVAGAAAIVRSIRPNSTPAQVRQVLLSTSKDIGMPGTDALYGAGLLDVAAVVAGANALPMSSPSTPTPAPSPTPTPTPTPGPTPAPEPSPTPPPQPSASQPTEPGSSTPSPTGPSPTNGGAVQRASGADRFATAAALSSQQFPSGSSHVWVATGASFADALAAGGAAGRQNGPLLLVEGCGVPEATAGEVARLRPASITVVGGGAAVCDGVLSHLQSLTGVAPGRVAGADRHSDRGRAVSGAVERRLAHSCRGFRGDLCRRLGGRRSGRPTGWAPAAYGRVRIARLHRRRAGALAPLPGDRAGRSGCGVRRRFSAPSRTGHRRPSSGSAGLTASLRQPRPPSWAGRGPTRRSSWPRLDLSPTDWPPARSQPRAGRPFCWCPLAERFLVRFAARSPVCRRLRRRLPVVSPPSVRRSPRSWTGLSPKTGAPHGPRISAGLLRPHRS